MPKNKGTNYYFTTQKLLERKGPDAVKAFLGQLTTEEAEFHKKALEVSWLDADRVSSVLAKAGKIIFPDAKRPLLECGRLEARDHLTGMYRILLKFASVEMVMKQTAKIWKQYHDTGKAFTEKKAEKHMILYIEDYPQLTVELRDIVAGFCQGTIELTGAKDVAITIHDQNPNQWQFEVKWK